MSKTPISPVKLTLTIPAQEQSLAPTRLSLKRPDGLELKQVKVTIWKRPTAKIGVLVFDVIAALYEKIAGSHWHKLEDANHRDIVWINRKSAVNATFEALMSKVGTYHQTAVVAEVTTLFNENCDKIKQFLHNEPPTLQLKPKKAGHDQPSPVLILGKTADGNFSISLQTQVGIGSFKRVYKVDDIMQNKIFGKALADAPNAAFKKVYNEEARLCQELHKSIGTGIIGFDSFTTGDKKVWTIMEYCGGGSLAVLIEKQEKAQDDQARAASLKDILPKIYSAAVTINEMHKLNYVHGDIKPENIMLTDQQETRIIDFGFTQKTGEPLKGATPAYLAPELFFAEDRMMKKVDIKQDAWSLGVVLFEAITGKGLADILPNSNKPLTQEILGHALDTFSWGNHGSTELTDVVKKLLKIDLNERSSIGDILPELQTAIKNYC